MDLKALHLLDINDFYPHEFNCDCGVKHVFETQKIAFKFMALDKLGECMGELVPELASVLIVSDKQASDNGALRELEKRLIRLKYRVSIFTFSKQLRSTVEEADSVEINEATKFIIGIGGSEICDITKYVGAKENLDTGFILTCPTAATRSLAPSSLLIKDCIEETYKTPAFKFLICDTNLLSNANSANSTKLAASFGETFSKFVALLDYSAANILQKEPLCQILLRQAQLILDNGLKKIEIKGKASIADIIAVGLKFSAITQIMGNSRLFSGAESQSAHALSILLCREEREKLNRGEAEFILARAVACIYQRFLGMNKKFFTPPPDNNMRLEQIEEFLGLEQSQTIKKIRPIVEHSASELREFRLNENRIELFNISTLNIMRLKRAFAIFKRLYDDDGFWLTKALDTSDTALSISLAPDLKDKFTILSHMKDMGLLDEYIKELV